MTAAQHASHIQMIIARADALAANAKVNSSNATEIISRTSDRMQTARF